MPLFNNSQSSAVLTTGNQSIAGVKTFTDTTLAVNTATGAVVIAGGLGVGSNVYFGNSLVLTNASASFLAYCVTVLLKPLTTAGRKSALTTKTANYTTVVTDEFILVDATSAARTITLLAAATAGIGAKITIIKTDASANAVTVTSVLSGGVLSTQYASGNYVSNDTSWYSY